MNSFLLVVGIVPLVLFVAVSFFGTYKQGIWTAMGSGVLALIAFVAYTGEFDETLFAEVVLIIALGLISLKLKNPLFFKFQPVVTALVMALFLAWFQIYDRPYFEIAFERFGSADPRFEQLLAMPLFKERISSISHQLIWLLLFHGALVGLSAIKLKDLGWLMTRLAIYPLMFLMIFLNFFLMDQPS